MILKSPSKIHTDLRRLLSDLIQHTPKEHVEYEQLTEARQNLDELIRELKESTQTSENVRKLLTVSSIIKECPFPIISGGQTFTSSHGGIGQSSLNQSGLNLSITSSQTWLPKNRGGSIKVAPNSPFLPALGQSSNENPATPREGRQYIQHGGLQWVKDQLTEKKISGICSKR